jgi:hypothetical protein
MYKPRKSTRKRNAWKDPTHKVGGQENEFLSCGYHTKKGYVLFTPATRLILETQCAKGLLIPPGAVYHQDLLWAETFEELKNTKGTNKINKYILQVTPLRCKS